MKFMALLITLVSVQSLFQRKSAKLTLKSEKRKYEVYSGDLTLNEFSSLESLDFKYLVYKSKNPLNRLLVLTPNIEGVTVLERRLAHRLSKEGFHVLVPFARGEDIAFNSKTTMKIERVFERAMGASLAMISFLKEQLDFDENQMGLIGASQGGIRCATLYGLDSRFKAIFTAVAGSDLPSIYANTEIDELVKFRKSHMSGIHLESVSGYEEHLRSRLILDPSLISQNPHLDGVAMIIANNDTIVPTANQWKLWKNVKNAGVHPKTIVKNVSHVTGALMLIRHEAIVVDWFSKKLNTPL